MTHKKPYNSKVFHPLAITVSLIVLLTFGNALGIGHIGTAANDTGTGSNEVITPIEGNRDITNLLSSTECQVKLTTWGDPELENYKIYLENTFSNKSNTSSLMKLGMARYDKFKTDVRNQLEVLIGRQIDLASASGASNSAQITGLAACEQIARDYIDNAGKLLQMRAITTSGIKKASIFVEKYQQINTKLRVLSQDFMKMTANFTGFEAKLPCFLKTCV